MFFEGCERADEICFGRNDLGGIAQRLRECEFLHKHMKEARAPLVCGLSRRNNGTLLVKQQTYFQPSKNKNDYGKKILWSQASFAKNRRSIKPFRFFAIHSNFLSFFVYTRFKILFPL